jgi:hypothetical protein
VENEQLDLLPREEQLVRLYEAAARFGLHYASALGGPLTPADAHRREFGHRLRFGCCRGVPADAPVGLVRALRAPEGLEEDHPQ